MNTAPTNSASIQTAIGELMEALPYGFILRLDANLQVLTAEGSGLAALGLEPKALIGRTLPDLLPPKLRDLIEPRLWDAVGGAASSFELPGAGDGRLLLAAAPTPHAQAAGDNRGEHTVQLFGVWQGADEDTVKVRRGHKERLGLAVRAGNIALWDWDLRTDKVHFSPEWKKLLGYEDHEIGDEFDEWASRVHPDDLAQELAGIQQYLAAPRADYRSELRLRHRDGTYRHILSHAAVEYGDDGQPIHLYGSDIDVTAREQVEAALRENTVALRKSEEKFAKFFQLSPVAMNVSRLEDGEILDVNDAFIGLFGYSRHELLGRSPIQLGMFTVAALGPMYASMAAHGRLRDAELAITGKLGVVKECLVSAEVLELPEGPCLLLSMVDISARKRSEQLLRASEAALKRSQEVAHVGHWTWDARTNKVAWSDEMKRILGLDLQAFEGDIEQLLARAIHPDDAARVGALSAAVVDDRRPGELEFRVVWPDGSIRHVRAIPADGMRDEHGNILQLWGVVQDVTERKLRELEREQLLLQLQDKAEQLAKVMRSVPEGVLLLDNLGCMVLANPWAEQMLGPLAEYDADRRLLRLGDTALDALLTSPADGQWHTLHKGRQIFEAIATPVESGPLPSGWVLVLREVTAERAVQEQLQRQERLAAVGQLAAGIAHDFNNIMSVISIYAELTSEAPGLTAKERARTLTIIEQAQRATRMIRQILDFSRRSVFERQVLDLLPLLKEEEKLLRQTLPENIEIRCECTPGEYVVMGEPTRLQQLVMNLAVNARDAMPEGGRLQLSLQKLTVTAAKHAPVLGMTEGEWLCFEMQDTGEGIPPEHIPHIFEPFFTTKEPGKGTGLGLAQAHGIVAQHNGHIAVASVPAGGTTFHVYLPAVPVATAAPGGGRQLDLPSGNGERVLVVEDEATLRESLFELLASLNYRVVEAANGAEALARLRQVFLPQDGTGEAAAEGPIEVILSDVVMPRMGGIALLKALRQEGIHVPAILMSGHPLREDRTGLEELGMRAWLDKPPTRQQVAMAMAEVVAQLR